MCMPLGTRLHPCSLLDFKEVAGMLKQLDPAHSMRSARNAAMEALLLCDMDADRVLTPAEFQLLLKRWVYTHAAHARVCSGSSSMHLTLCEMSRAGLCSAMHSAVAS
jgi:hypothetical protein